MVRAPCCEKMGLKKGPWTPEEDKILINYIQLYGHGNWRALPKQAGLLRCGKSCRLRWTNYLRPDIKRGNFSKEEEDTIIKLHEMLGNRWSAIAAKLPGRTDNEIKNVWHTHLKKRLKQNQDQSIGHSKFNQISEIEPIPVSSIRSWSDSPVSPQQSCSDVSSSTVAIGEQTNFTSNYEIINLLEDNFFPEMDGNFWPEFENLLMNSEFSRAKHDQESQFPTSALTTIENARDSGPEAHESKMDGNYWPEFENLLMNSEFSRVMQDQESQFPASTLRTIENAGDCGAEVHEGMEFWYNVFTRTGESL